MNVNIPGLSDVIAMTKEMPEQFDELCIRLDTVIQLLTETNEILKSK